MNLNWTTKKQQQNSTKRKKKLRSVRLYHQHEPHKAEAQLRKKIKQKRGHHLQTTNQSSHCTANPTNDKDVRAKTPSTAHAFITNDDPR
jgi:hypothetical protein